MTIWKIIPDTNNRYKISNHGKVYSLLNKKERKPYLSYGKLRIRLYIGKKKVKDYYIHKLVYESFKNNIKNSQHVYHIDNNIYNNYIDNLKLIMEPPILPNETWKDIDGYKNRYKISNLGRVYSSVSNKLLKQCTNLSGYKYIKLFNKKGKDICFLVHRLVALNFIGKIPDGRVVDHIDRNKLNNNKTNLRIVTVSTNNKNVDRKDHNIIQQYDLDGKLLCEYDKMSDVLKKCSIKSPKHIYDCMNRHRKTSHGFIWKYKYKKKKKKKESVKDNNFKQIGIFDDDDFSNYEINKLGQIRNIKTKKILKNSIHDGYYKVNITSKKKKYKRRVHRLLAHVYIAKENNEYNVVNHIDENKLNNDLNNLEWTTHKLNTQHSLAIKVKQINKKTNELIKIHNSIRDAYRALGKKCGKNIPLVCTGKQKSAFGYKWLFCKNETSAITI